MLSRVAENIYWMARYLERAEDTARLISVNTNLLLDLPRGVAPGWEPLIAMTGSQQLFRQRYDECSERKALQFLIGDVMNPSSILSSMSGARENCRTIRDIVPREAWEQINEAYLYARDNVATGLSKGGRHAYLKRAILGSQTITGILAGTMNHDQGYQFLRLGRFLERADMTSRIVDVRSSDLLPEQNPELRPYENIQWMSVLKSLSGYQMYRQSRQVRVQRQEVLKFLFLSEHFPRAVQYCLRRLEASLASLARHEPVKKVIAELEQTLHSIDLAALSQEALHQFIDNLQLGLMRIHAELSRVYFPPPVTKKG